MRCRLPLVLAIALLLPVPAGADWLMSPFVGLRFGADTTLLIPAAPGIDEKKFAWGVAGALLTDGVLGLEVEFSYIPGFFTTGEEALASSRVVTLTGNVIVAAPLSATGLGLRPYVTGGLGLLHARAQGTPPLDVLPIASDYLAMNIGGGAIGPISPRSSIRFDIRHVRSTTTDEQSIALMPGTQLSFWRASVGLTLHFRR